MDQRKLLPNYFIIYVGGLKSLCLNARAHQEGRQRIDHQVVEFLERDQRLFGLELGFIGVTPVLWVSLVLDKEANGDENKCGAQICVVALLLYYVVDHYTRAADTQVVEAERVDGQLHRDVHDVGVRRHEGHEQLDKRADERDVESWRRGDREHEEPGGVGHAEGVAHNLVLFAERGGLGELVLGVAHDLEHGASQQCELSLPGAENNLEHYNGLFENKHFMFTVRILRDC